MSCQQATACLVQQNISAVCQNTNNSCIGNIDNVGGCTSSDSNSSSSNCNYIHKANNKSQTISTTSDFRKSNFSIARASASSPSPPTTGTTTNQQADSLTDTNKTVAANLTTVDVAIPVNATDVDASRISAQPPTSTTPIANLVNSNAQLATGCESANVAISDKCLQNTLQRQQQKNHQLQQTTTTTTKTHNYNAGKKLSNVCIVRPQQQQPQHSTYQLQHHQHHQNHHQYHKHQQHNEYQQLQQHKLLLDASTATNVAAKSVASTLPTASLWQTPLLLQTMAAGKPMPAAAITSTTPLLPLSLVSAGATTTVTTAVTTTVTLAATIAGVGLTTNVAPLVNAPITTTGITAMAKVAPIVQAIPALKRSPPCYPNQFENLKDDKANGTPKICISPMQTSIFYDAPLKHSNIDIDINSFGNTFAQKTGGRLDEQELDKELIDHKNANVIHAKTVMELQTSSVAPTKDESKIIPPALRNEFHSFNDQINLAQHRRKSSIAIDDMTNHTGKASIKASKRKITSSCAVACNSINNNVVGTSISNQKKRRKTISSDLDLLDCSNYFVHDNKNVKAVAVVKMTEDELNNDTSVFGTEAGLSYCLQQHWMDYDDIIAANVQSSSKSYTRTQMREECIDAYKQQLQCQAMQLLSTHKLQKLPLFLARRRLRCVDQLLHKYKDTKAKPLSDDLRQQYCSVEGCKRISLSLASYCHKHIAKNSTQHIFVPCAGNLNDSTQCRQPVFAMNNNMNLNMNSNNDNDCVAFCSEHLHQSYEYYRNLEIVESMKISSANPMSAIQVQLQHAACSPAPLTQQQTKQQTSNEYAKSVVNDTPASPSSLMYLDQLSKTSKSTTKMQGLNKSAGDNKQSPSSTSEVITETAPIPTPSLAPILVRPQGIVHIASNPASATGTPTPTSTATAAATAPPTLPAPTPLSVPASSSAKLMPLFSSNLKNTNASSVAIESAESLTLSAGNSSRVKTMQLPPPALAPLSGANIPTSHLTNNGKHNRQSVDAVANNHLPLQFLNFAQNSSNQAYTKPSSNIQTDIQTKLYTNAMPNTTVKSSPLHIQRLSYFNSNSNSNFTSSGMGSTTSLPSMDSFLTQDVLSICENSSASSADTGLGGCISDTELMLSQATDADGIPLADSPLLEEHDLANALNSLPDDAFTELFASVRGDESDEIERAIEIADKNLRTLEQSIGSNFGDFLDFSDDMLANADGDFYNVSGSTAASMDAVASVLDDSNVFMDAAAAVATAAGITISTGAGATAGTGIGSGAGAGADDLLTDVKGLLQT